MSLYTQQRWQKYRHSVRRNTNTSVEKYKKYKYLFNFFIQGTVNKYSLWNVLKERK